MQTLTEEVFHLAPPGGLFDDSVVKNLFPNLSDGARNLLLHRAVRHGEVLRLKRGLFCLNQSYRKTPLHPFVVAAALHSPSHVSFESALAYHGLIPEAVFQIGCATTERTRSFMTPLGKFTFTRVPTRQPRAGVRAEQLDLHGWAFVASPLRAIADLVYMRRDASADLRAPNGHELGRHADTVSMPVRRNLRRGGEEAALDFLIHSMRIEEDDLARIPTEEFKEIRTAFRNRRVLGFLANLHRSLHG
ncbi:MAG: hypothetical protein KAY24_09270 [Candidatus Eisenbacteria sp.]|nr:hypothetical protein [Candidatus Eisenbacteria bacterium]